MTDSWVTTHDARLFNDRVVHLRMKKIIADIKEIDRKEQFGLEESIMLNATSWEELKKQLRQLETKGKVVFKLERTA